MIFISVMLRLRCRKQNGEKHLVELCETRLEGAEYTNIHITRIIIYSELQELDIVLKCIYRNINH